VTHAPLSRSLGSPPDDLPRAWSASRHFTDRLDDDLIYARSRCTPSQLPPEAIFTSSPKKMRPFKRSKLYGDEVRASSAGRPLLPVDPEVHHPSMRQEYRAQIRFLCTYQCVFGCTT
jgi:hypothetical protein